MKTPSALLLLLFLPTALGCTESDTEVTYHQDIAPILAANCLGCHNPDGMQPDILFDDAASAQSMAPMIASAVAAGTMPPFYAEETEECPNPWGFARDPRLEDTEVEAILNWVADGTPLGDAATAAPLPPSLSLDLSDADIEVFPAGQHTTPPIGAVEDEFICFSLDPGITEQRWLEAYQVLPDNLSITHHLLLGIDATGESAALADENGIYPCFGGFGVDAMFIGGWIPNASPVVFPANSAVRVPEEARIVFQMHYHLASEAQSDATGVALRWADNTPVREANMGLIGNADEQEPGGLGLQPGPNDSGSPTFLIPAEATGHTETMAFDLWSDIPRELEVFLVANHMHYVGTDMRLWLERGDAAAEPEDSEACLVHTPRWDFDWQQFYHYDTSVSAPRIHPGDELWMQCEYDNVTENPGVARALMEAGLESPIDVSLGNGSLDEMCIGIVGSVYRIPTVIDGESHAGLVALQTSSDDLGFAQACNGPSSLRVDISGSMSGLAACGLDVLDALTTVEISFDGTDHGDGTASGEMSVSALGIEGGGTATWSGSYDGDTLVIDVNQEPIFAGYPVLMQGSITALKAQ